MRFICFFFALVLSSFNIFAANCDKSIHLTFDDGPHPERTRVVIDALNRENVPATFFINAAYVNQGQVSRSQIENSGIYHTTGGGLYGVNHSHIEQRINLLREISGNRMFHIASHGFAHFSFLAGDRAHPGASLDTYYSREENIEFSTNILERYLDTPRVFRLPFGKPYRSSHPRERQSVEELLGLAGYDFHLGWDIDSRDAFSDETERAFKNRLIREICSSGGVILFHDTKVITANTIRDIIRGVKRNGGRFVSLFDRSLRTRAFDRLNTSNSSNDPIADLIQNSSSNENSTYCPAAKTGWTHVSSLREESSVGPVLRRETNETKGFSICCETGFTADGWNRVYCR